MGKRSLVMTSVRAHRSMGLAPKQMIEFKSIPEPNTGCWLWLGRARNDWGYGEVFILGRRRLAHRASFEVHRGLVPPGMKVLHRCDTPACVNPDHLWLGTNTDNMRDMAAKGRTGTARGEANARAKLTRAAVEELRGRVELPGSVAAWAAEFGVSRRLIRLVLDGKVWRWMS